MTDVYFQNDKLMRDGKIICFVRPHNPSKETIAHAKSVCSIGGGIHQLTGTIFAAMQSDGSIHYVEKDSKKT